MIFFIRKITGDYFADLQGDWSGVTDFSYGQGIYFLRLDDVSMDMKFYSKIMNIFKTALKDQDDLAKNRSLTDNILVWLSWQLNCEYEFCSTQLITLSGNAKYTFNADKYGASMSNEEEDFLINSWTTYSIEDSVFRTIKKDLILIEVLITFDGRTFAESIGVNMGYLNVYDISELPKTLSRVHWYNGISYFFQKYVDPFYVGMYPLTCISTSNSTAQVQQLCFMEINQFMTLPIFNHYGLGGSSNSPDGNVPLSCEW